MDQQIEKLDELWKDGQCDLTKALVNQLPAFEAFVWYCKVFDKSHGLRPQPTFQHGALNIFGSPTLSSVDFKLYYFYFCMKHDHEDGLDYCFGRGNMVWSIGWSEKIMRLIPKPTYYNFKSSYRLTTRPEFYGSAD